MTKKLTLNLIDFQNDFVFPDGALTFDNGKGDISLIKRVERFLMQMPNNLFASAIVTYDTHHLDTYFQTEESKTFPPHCLEGEKGWCLAVNPDYIHFKIPIIQNLKKSTYDMWANSIDTVSQTIINQTDEVVLFGVASDICNKAALLGWIKQDVKVTILKDLTRGIFKQTDEVLKEPPFAAAVANGKIKTMTAQAFLHQQKQRSRA